MKCEVCGMLINEKNYDFNESAFLIKNSIYNIIYCPFCGVCEVYLSKEDKIIKVDSEKLDEKILKILDHAVKLELFNGDFYEIAATMAKNPETKKVFEALSRIEKFHAKIHQRLGGFNKMPSLNKVSYSKYDSDDALLILAKQKEEHAVAFYEMYKNEIDDKNLARIFNALIKVEEDHIILTKK